VASSFTWDTSKFKSPKEMERQLERALYATVKYWDGPIERHMKHNAPWRDRTTNARNGLFAVARRLGRSFAILLGHSVDYGIYLEAKPEDEGGRPIIMPTIRLYAPKVMKTLHKLLDRLG
jgi:hypothetical protein